MTQVYACEEHKQLCYYIDKHLSGDLEEGIMPDVIIAKFEFFNELAVLASIDFKQVLMMVKSSYVYKMFEALKFSLAKVMEVAKKAYKLWNALWDAVAIWVRKNKITKVTRKNLKELDKYLSTHPKLKGATGVVVGAFLVFQWTLLISFTGNVKFDFDQSNLMKAIDGNFKLADVFASAAGIKMLMFITTGVVTGASFPWGATGLTAPHLFLLSLVYTAARQIGNDKMGEYVYKTISRRIPKISI